MLKSNLYIIILMIYALVIGSDVIKLMKLIKKPQPGFNIDRYFFRIHMIVLAFGIALTLVLITFEVNIFNYSPPVEYKLHKEISFQDFKGFKFPGQTLQGGTKFAFITTNLDYQRKENSIEIKAYFHPSRSYVYIKNLQNDDLLRHEMYHFHITEIWARKFRKKVHEHKHLPTKTELNRIYKEIRLKLDKMQADYDYESNHGTLLGKQLYWQNRVDSVLNVLNPYSNTYVSF